MRSIAYGPVAILISGLLSSCALPPTMTADLRGRECAAYADELGDEIWAVPFRDGDRHELDAWCRAVGPAVYRPSPGISGPNLAAGDSVAVIVWNVGVGSGDVVEFLRSEIGAQCGPSPTSEMHAVLLLQEVLRRDESVPGFPEGSERQPTVRERASDRERIDLITIADRCRLALFYVPSSRNGDKEYADGREDLGNAILSTLPLQDPFAIELPHEASRRVAAGAAVQLPSVGPIRFVSVHFNTFPGPWKLLRTGNSSRVRQALAFGEGLVVVEGQLGTLAAPVVAGGDLNTWSTQEGAFRQMLRLFPESPAWHGEPTRGSFPTDHLFFRTGSAADSVTKPNSYRRITNDYNSDHYPVIAWLSLPPR